MAVVCGTTITTTTNSQKPILRNTNPMAIEVAR
jgi:hypothetical protein